MAKRIRPLAAWACLALATPGLAAEPGLTRFEATETHMGSAFTVLLYCPDEVTARHASRAAFGRIAELDAALSDYNPESELMRLCDRSGGPPVPASADLFRVLERSRDVWSRSGGAFDPTIAPVVRLWRRARRTKELPAADTLAHARSLVGFDSVKLDAAAQTVQLTRPGTKLDLGGIAKGYAAWEAVAALKRLGIDRALVAGAGDIACSGPPPDKVGWTVAIPGPDGKPGRSILLHDAAVSTAGDTEQFVEIGGKRYSHIVDPKTGLGLTDLMTVTVVAPDGATADALDTTARILGPEAGLKLIDATPGASGLLVRLNPDGTRQTFESSRFRDLTPAPAEPASAGP